jgi:hypothetical protein
MEQQAMSDVTVYKNDQGKLEGWTEKGKRAYSRFLAACKNLEPGEMLSFSYRAPRKPKPHKFFFCAVKQLFSMQEQFADEDRLRQWLIVGAGHCDFYPGPQGRMVAVAHSMNWESMDDNDFHELFNDVLDFVWTGHLQRFLWGHLSDAQQSEMAQRFVDELERGRLAAIAKAEAKTAPTGNVASMREAA